MHGEGLIDLGGRGRHFGRGEPLIIDEQGEPEPQAGSYTLSTRVLPTTAILVSSSETSGGGGKELAARPASL